MRDKILNMKQAIELCSEYRDKNQKYTVVLGCFDIIHEGHVGLIKEAKELGYPVIVGIKSDKDMKNKSNKGEGRPVVHQMSRAVIMDSLKYVDHTFIYNYSDKLIEELKPSFHIKGPDHKYSKNGNIEKEIVERNGGQFLILGPKKIRSTTKIIDKKTL